MLRVFLISGESTGKIIVKETLFCFTVEPRKIKLLKYTK